MVEIQGNMWEIDTDCLFITTNGFVKRDGSAVMGRGCALEATKIIPNIAKSLGQAIARHGNRINTLVSTWKVGQGFTHSQPNQLLYSSMDRMW